MPFHIHINEKIIERTDKCPVNHQCLSDYYKCLCGIEKTYENSLLLKERTLKDCPYMEPAMEAVDESSYICTCPVRIELYRLSQKRFL